MPVEVKFFAEFKDIVGSRSIEVSADDVQDLLEKITEENEKLRGRIYSDFESDEVDKNINIMINGRSISYLNGLDTELEDGDSLAIFSKVAGGNNLGN